MDPANHPRYVAPSIDISYDDYGTARVTDGIIVAAGQGYVIGEVTVRPNKRMIVRWRVQDVKPDPREYRFRNADLIVRLTIETATGKASMSILDATRSDYSYQAVGKCRLSD